MRTHRWQRAARSWAHACLFAGSPEARGGRRPGLHGAAWYVGLSQRFPRGLPSPRCPLNAFEK